MNTISREDASFESVFKNIFKRYLRIVSKINEQCFHCYPISLNKKI